MKTLSDFNLALASAAAQEATIDYIFENGEHPFNCGFAWVEVKGARGNTAKLLKEHGFKKRYDGPGLKIWNPSNNPTQDMNAKMAGAEFYAHFLRECGVDAEAHCRLD